MTRDWRGKTTPVAPSWREIARNAVLAVVAAAGMVWMLAGTTLREAVAGLACGMIGGVFLAFVMEGAGQRWLERRAVQVQPDGYPGDPSLLEVWSGTDEEHARFLETYRDRFRPGPY